MYLSDDCFVVGLVLEADQLHEHAKPCMTHRYGFVEAEAPGCWIARGFCGVRRG